MQWYFIVLICAAALLLAASLALAFAVLSLTVSKKGVAANRAKIEASGAPPSPYRRHTPEAAKWWASQNKTAVKTAGFKGIELNGWFLPAEKPANRCALVMHGHDCDSASIAFISRMFHEDGWNVLAPEMRAGAHSGGNSYSFGYYESRDALAWLDKIKEICGADCSVAAYGNSLGGGTVCMLSGLEAPPQLRCIVSDCAFTSLRGVAAYQLKGIVPAPFRVLPLLLASVLCKIIYGFWFSQACPVKAVAESKTPMLFVHGQLDPLIPVEMAEQLYSACAAQKEMYIVPNMKHGEAYFGNPKKFTEIVCGFCRRFCE